MQTIFPEFKQTLSMLPENLLLIPKEFPLAG
jgi:hypothetical protein